MEATPSPVAVSVVDTVTAPLGRQARRLLSRAVPAELIDDRFDAWPADDGDPAWSGDGGFRAAAATLDGELVGYIGGSTSRNRFQVDCIIDPAVADPVGLGARMLELLGSGPPPGPADQLELWGKPAQAWHETLAAAEGMEPHRALHQMRCRLPVDLEPVPTRPFRPDDLHELVAVNNRSFASHPDQGGQSAEDLRGTMAQPWFRPEGLRIHERDGRIAGFCWTKIHPAPDPGGRLGEIYVIGVDPDFHGRGLGRPMTAAGLAWLAEQGITTGMLYVEADNEPAVRTYLGLGFTIVRTDRAWTRPLEAAR